MGDSSADGSTAKEDAGHLAGHADDARFDALSVECYRRRDQVLSGVYRTEWWMAFAVVLITAGIAFVVL